MDERSSVRPVQDTRRPAYGWGRILVGVFAVFGAIVLVPSLTTLLRSPDEEPAVWSLNLLGGVLYLLLAVCVAHNGRRMRNIGWMCLGALATMAVLIGVLTLPAPSPAELSVSVWAHWGRSRWYLPAILPVVAAAWMWMSDPRRIVANAERITELSDTLTGRSRRAGLTRRPAVVGTGSALRKVLKGAGACRAPVDSHRRLERRELRELTRLIRLIRPILRRGTGRECHLS